MCVRHCFSVCSTAEVDTIGLLKVAVRSRKARRQRVGISPASAEFPRTNSTDAQGTG